MSATEKGLPAASGLGFRNAIEVIYIMGTARSGSTLLGTLMGQAPWVFYAGELAEWPERDGYSTVSRSVAFWREVRDVVGGAPDGSDRLKLVMEHPLGLLIAVRRGALIDTYREVTLGVLRAISSVSGCSTIVDSSHYPRRARALRRLLGPESVRLVFMVRRPSSVARSLRSTGDKSELKTQLYLMVVGILAWLVYLTHPCHRRTLVSYESLVEEPVDVAIRALGGLLEGVDPTRLTAPLVFIGNRFVKGTDRIAVQAPRSHERALQDRITDLIQIPLSLACLMARHPPR